MIADELTIEERIELVMAILYEVREEMDSIEDEVEEIDAMFPDDTNVIQFSDWATRNEHYA